MFLISIVITCALFADGKLTSRIINGNNVIIEDYPYQVLVYSNTHFCGGSIISEYHVLAAAHCFHDAPDADYLMFRVGSSYPSRDGRLYKIDEYIIHQGFSIVGDETFNDISILKVDKPFQYDDTCQPILLFNANEKAVPGTKSIVTVYGLVANLKPADQLQSVVLSIISKEDCKKVYDNLFENKICALGENGKIPCNGDSSGPLAIDGRLAGIDIWTKPGCIAGYPSVYTEIAKYRD